MKSHVPLVSVDSSEPGQGPSPAASSGVAPRMRLVLLGRTSSFQPDWLLGTILVVFVGWTQWLALPSVEGVAIRYRLLIWLGGVANAAIFLLALIAVSGWLARSGRAWLRWLWGGCVGLVALGFYADLLLFRMMAIHLSTGVRLLVENGWKQGWLTLEASGVRAGNLWEAFFWIILAFVNGVAVTSLTRRFWARRLDHDGKQTRRAGDREIERGLNSHEDAERQRGGIEETECQQKGTKETKKGAADALPGLRAVLVWVAMLVLGLTLWEWSWQSDNARAKAWEEVHRVMPFTIDLLHRVSGDKLAVGPLRPFEAPVQPELPLSAGNASPTATGGRPDIFVFVLESVRRDYITPQVAPNLWRYGQDCVSIGGTVASGNATHISWFSLLTANHSLYFSMAAKRPELWGSRALRVLRQSGYEIHALAATHLAYHDVDRMVFGRDLELCSAFADVDSLDESLERPARDREMARRLLAEIPKKSGGRIFLVFFDSTHHDYYWPDDFAAPFQPYLKSWDYFDFGIGPEKLERIRNRYRNAVHFVDSVFGQVLDGLKAQGRYEDALMFVTGDHGEEFLEHGKLVHASELWREQIEVPFLLKLPRGVHPTGIEQTSRITASHADVLPTVLDVLGLLGTNEFDGESIFRKTAAAALVADDNGARDPYRFCLIHGNRKAWLRYRSDSTMIALEHSLYLVNLTDFRDRPLPVMAGTSQERVRFLVENFGHELSRLYPEWQPPVLPKAGAVNQVTSKGSQ